MKIKNENGFAHPTLFIILVVAVITISVAGFRVYQANNDKKQSHNSEVQAPEEKLLPANIEDILSFEQVKELATQNTEALITDFELGNEDGILVYKVVLSDGTFKVFNAHTGAVVDTGVDNDLDDSEEGDDVLPASFTISISFDEARNTAQAIFPDSKILKIQLDVEAGVVVLSVRFTDKARVDINAINGEVVRTKNPRVDEKASNDSDDKSSESSSNASSTSGSSGSGSSGNDSSSSSEDSDNEIRVEGSLSNSNGKYTVSENGKTYTIKTTQNLSGFVGKKVRVEGNLLANNVIQLEKIDER